MSREAAHARDDKVRSVHVHGTDLHLGFDQHPVVRGVSLELRPGQVVGLIGPNGSGKSTLLRGLARLHTPAGGRLYLIEDDQESSLQSERMLNSLSASEFAREVTLFAQNRSAPPGFSVRDIVAFGRHPHRRLFAGMGPRDRDAVDDALSATGLQDMGGRAACELSGGELQRVWLAACLAQETSVVLLDEPTNHLDLRYQMEVLDLIRFLAEDRGVAVGVVLHDLNHAAEVVDHLILLHEGRVIASGPPLAVLTPNAIRTAYEVEVIVSVNRRTDRLRIDPVGRRGLRRYDPSTE